MQKTDFKTTLRYSKKGFTLVELLVALALFGVVSILGVTAFLAIIASNRTSQSVSSVISNFNLALEAMSRNIRVGTVYHCDTYSGSLSALTENDCPVIVNGVDGGKSTMTFLSENGTDWYTYSFDGPSNSIHKALNGVDQGAITATEVTVTKLEFYVIGATNSIGIPPNKSQARVIIIIQGLIDNGPKGKVPFNIQTTVSERIIP